MGLRNSGVEKVAVDHGGGQAVLQDVANLERMELDVDGDGGGPQAEESEQGLQKRGCVVLEDGHPVPLADPQVPQGPGQSTCAPVELPVVQDPVALHQGRLVWVGPGGAA